MIQKLSKAEGHFFLWATLRVADKSDKVWPKLAWFSRTTWPLLSLLLNTFLSQTARQQDLLKDHLPGCFWEVMVHRWQNPRSSKDFVYSDCEEEWHHADPRQSTGMSYPSWDQHFRGFTARDDPKTTLWLFNIAMTTYPKPHLAMTCHEALYCHWCLHIHHGCLQRCEADGWSDGNQLECPQGLSRSKKL